MFYRSCLSNGNLFDFLIWTFVQYQDYKMLTYDWVIGLCTFTQSSRLMQLEHWLPN